MMFACTWPGCARAFDTRDELVDHLTDKHDAFSAVTVMHGRVEP